ncbi:MAG: hypothetical protein OI74_03045 [Gammaproteobacteria bacterium (ex Lamellibrachia satsuma)]|nr:MAG: hypothetical protein HPY30_12135 [Gammaproteobacteria bacterium (ex Lamellibrachia satsuma)]RRS34418.1 MAG: hypothetical protein NV67_13005 [Gammaproteobacteria bacterium (ex Lamellibrachia satsuma)]RRS35080.1 MAG: hypothetical protein OI74_03045 [Gammaproteobacteria bacterium (ex Lamellibrachia satsuma)]
MSDTTLFSILESPTHPDFSALYRRLGIRQVEFRSMRKVMSELKRQQPDIVVAEFFYGYANNYAGINISNLDVFLFSLQKYAPETRVIVLVEKSEREYVGELNEIFPLHAVLVQPVKESQIELALAGSKMFGEKM